MKFFDSNSSGSLLTRVNSDIESLSDLFSGIVIHFIRDIFLMVQIMVAMLLLDAEIALWCFTIIPVIAALTFVYRTLARRNFIKLKAQLSKLNGFLAENITGMKMVQIYCREKVKNEEFLRLGKEYYRYGMVEITLNSLSHPLMNALANIFVAILLSSFSARVIGGSLDLGVLYAFAQYIKEFSTRFPTCRAVHVNPVRDYFGGQNIRYYRQNRYPRGFGAGRAAEVLFRAYRV